MGITGAPGVPCTNCGGITGAEAGGVGAGSGMRMAGCAMYEVLGITGGGAAYCEEYGMGGTTGYEPDGGTLGNGRGGGLTGCCSG